ncbi:MAG: hypothetical protein CVU39_25935 [Chloroflexi bacterium HGW-Chloroflexi-10]|nr:MAG: hypothetical protein CVU39_25935 [Chloroflexi bacterium HGW-Chloroflexi-10]
MSSITHTAVLFRFMLFIVLIGASVAPAFAAPIVAQEGPGTGLFLPPSDSKQWTPPAPDDPVILRARPIAINWPVLEAEQNTPQESRLLLNLFEDLTLTAVLDRLEAGYEGGFIWQGHLEGVEMSEVLLAANQGILAGKIAWPGSVYTIRYSGSEHEIAQIDQVALGSGLEPIPVDSAPLTTAESETPADASAKASGYRPIVDLMVVYTADARSAAGGTTAMHNEIQMMVAEGNMAYANSDVNQRFQLVYMGEVAYTETNNASLDLGRLRTPDDGFLDEALTWRNTYHADTVSMITQTGGCGLGYVMTTVSSGFEDTAFNVGTRTCFIGNVGMPHEQGHNMGLNHDWYLNSNLNPFPFAHGYAYPAGQFRTIMAYNTLCTASGTSCTTLPYFSNPAIAYNGAPMGVASDGPINCVSGQTTPVDPTTCAADNRLALNMTAATVTQFRNGQITWTGAVSSDWQTAANWTIPLGRPGATTASARVPLNIDSVYIPASPAGGRFPSISGGSARAFHVTLASGARLQMSGGSLEVYGNWTEDAGAIFSGQGGSVIFKGALEQSISPASGSYFNDLVIGDGLSTQLISAGADLDVNGDLTIQSGAALLGGSFTQHVAGDFNDNGTSFSPETSTVILDGSGAQALKRLNTSAALLDETFEIGTGKDCCSTAYIPPGWVRYGAWYGGTWSIDLSHGGILVQWNNVTDGWMFSPAFYLKPDVNYSSAFDFRNGNYGAVKTYSLHIGRMQSSGAMTQLVSTGTGSSTTWATQNGAFSVAEAGYYYLGFRVQTTSGTSYALLDNVSLDAQADSLLFYNLEIAPGALVTQHNSLLAKNDLTVDSGGLLDVGSQDFGVDGRLSNHGLLRQQTGVSQEKPFLGTGSYGGLMVNPNGQNLGMTRVQILGSQDCTTNPGETVRRCFFITPEIDPSSASTLTFFFSASEIPDGQTCSAMEVYRSEGAAWSAALARDTSYGTQGRSCAAEPYSIRVSSVGGLSAFVLKSGGAPSGALATLFKAAPNHDAMVNPKSLTLFWNSTTLAEGYDYCYDMTDDGECDSWQSSAADPFVTLNNLEPGVTYYWQVRAHYSGETVVYADEGSWWSFTTEDVHEVFLPLLVK